MEKVLIVGAGGHAKVIIDMLLQNNRYEVAGLIDKNLSAGFYGIPVLGNDDALPEIYSEGRIKYAFVALGSGALREKVTYRVKDAGFELINVISRHAIISPTVRMGAGIAIMPGAVINADVSLGDGCIINTNSSVDHEGNIGEYTHIAPGCAISGCVHIGRQCFLGTGSRVIDRINIGNNTIVGAGAAVVKDIEGNCTVVGVPARKIR